MTTLSSIAHIDLTHNAKSHNKVITIDPNAKIMEALEVLVTNGIKSAPITYKVSDSESRTTVIELGDIMKLIIDTYSDDDKYLDEDIQYILQHTPRKNVHDLAAVDIANLAKNANFIAVSEGASLLDVASAMGTEGVRRVLVFDKNGQVSNVVTQSTLLEVLLRHRHEMGSLLNLTVASAFPENTRAKIYSVKASSSTIEAFRMIIQHKINSVAVVDDQNGKLLGSISIRDVETIGLEKQRIRQLYSTAGQFVADKKANKEPFIPITTTVQETMASVLDKMELHPIQQVWVVNDDFHPIGVVTVTDLLQLTAMPIASPPK